MAYDIEQTLSDMTLEQKCALLSGQTAFGTRTFEGLDLPRMQFSDGPHGLRHQGEGANHLGIGGSDPATCFPTAVTLSQTWEPALAERVGEALAEEAATMGVGVVLGPGLCIKRSPLCGRNFEYVSEDPLVAGRMAAGYVRGIQSQGLAACPKHLAANSQETRRQASDSVVDERTLREIYLAGFETVVRESDPRCIMTSYNQINGVYANESRWLLTDILRKEWGFDGAVVTDWGGSNDHAAGVAAGSTFEMPAPDLSSVRELVAAVKAGSVSEADVDARAREALRLIYSTDAAIKALPDTYDAEAHHALAREVAAKGIVLLKNEAAPDAAPLLPLAKGTRVALIGDFAQVPRYQGAGSSLVNATRVESLLEVVQASEDLELVGFEPGFERLGGENAGKAEAAISLARAADVVLFCMGLDEVKESEGLDRLDMRVNQNQVDLLHRVATVNPRVVVLLFAGSCVETPWLDDCRALVDCALGGQAGASAALEVLVGRQNSRGRLAETWPLRLEDTPTAGNFPAEEHTAEYREGPYVGYRYYRTAGVPVAFPFGYGLSYTSFAYSDLEATPEGVTFSLTNTGSMAGTEVAQVYVAKPDAQVFRPAEELKGWAVVELEPGESRRVSVPLERRSYAYFDVATGAWEVEGGSYELRVGASVEDIRLTVVVEVEGTGAANPYAGKELSAYTSGQVQQVDDAQFAALLGRDIPPARAPLQRNTAFRDLGRSRSPLLWLVSAVLTRLYRGSIAKGRPNLNLAFIYNMPLRAIPKQGMPLGTWVVDALVLEAKGIWIVGLALAVLIWALTGRLYWWLCLCGLILTLVAAVANVAANALFAGRIK